MGEVGITDVPASPREAELTLDEPAGTATPILPVELHVANDGLSHRFASSSAEADTGLTEEEEPRPPERSDAPDAGSLAEDVGPTHDETSDRDTATAAPGSLNPETNSTETGAVPEEHRICRICYGGPAEPDEPYLGRLISPCKCKGTMRFVHTGCLNEWRKVSRKKESFYQCDHCLYKYHFRRTTWAHWLTNEAIVTLITIGVFLSAVILAGFVGKLLVFLMSDDEEPEAADDDAVLWFLQGSRISFWAADRAHVYEYIVEHFLWGFSVVGMLGLSQMVVPLFSGPWAPRLPRIRNWNESSGSIVLIVSMCIGAVRALWFIWKAVRKWSRQKLSRMELAILDVSADA
ncbi:uncharacterized protein EV422DRAFT_427191 [Fimicolochytrium jonesii]|uniref:uncharacterized protein n=1 Tax=Fimicolochytrium jonesii TaxID=1396493 RepID=UPI0022FEF11A|nr:uncharacterized protein EV422DRAFT_427191 [Fimicolochytrium jonesii]KAI8821659.1 hypothetical protein EV422DRAFT_427191 [Fimicolochytrium jonesii]